DSIRQGQRLTGMTSTQATFPVAPSLFKFAQHGQSGATVSDLMPHTARIVDDLCFIRSMNTEQINHDPAITFCQTGFQLAGRPSIGSWLAYGLGSENQELPAFVVMISQGSGNISDQPLYDRLWGSGFLPSRYQGVKFRAAADPVLYLSNPPGIDPKTRRRYLDDLGALNTINQTEFNDPEIAARTAQYEMAFRMQTSVPELTDLSKEPESTFDLYGPDARRPGTFAANCLLARRLAERGVRFIQLFHRGWDQHTNLNKGLKTNCEKTDQGTAALIQDLKQRGLLEDTLIVWGGEFGRTPMQEVRNTLDPDNAGRDHHPNAYSMFLAGGGVKSGAVIGATDDLGFTITQDPVGVHDLQATIMHCLGFDHTRLTYRFMGRDFRLTDVHGEVIKKMLA
ncbi:MAG: DUF1501 domain-containing protein, partial [Acidobacteria bacterium]|nr:DUF1501 domain-containing protein [Acidobacteriota bacterium]